MFGDKPIIGLREGTMDQKRRLSLQSMSGIEDNESVALIFDKSRKYMKVCKVEEVNIEYQLLKRHIDAEFELIKITQDPEEIIKRIGIIEEKRNLLQVYNHSLIGIVTADKNKRISIPQLAAEELELKVETKLYLEGAFDHMNIYPNKEVYLEAKKALTERK